MTRSVVTVSALFRKKSAELSGGYYTRDDEVQFENRSQYNTKPRETKCSLGMGIVQGVLAVLSGHVVSFSWQDRGRVGLARVRSTTDPSTTYEFSWDLLDPAIDMYGGFAHSEGGPTYQLAVLALITNFLDYRNGGSDRSQEVMERWFALVDAMDGIYPRPTSRDWWSPATMGTACRNPAIQPHIERVADALWFTMRYQLPGLHLDRTIEVDDLHVVSIPLASPAGELRGAGLFARLTVPPLAGAGPLVVAQNGMVGAQVARVGTILDDGGGPLMLVGPQGVGKSSIPMRHAIDRGWGVEEVTLHEGWEASDLFGSSVQVLGEWIFVPGPLCRWAQRVLESRSSGTDHIILLILNEYTRGHKSIKAVVLSLLDQWTAEQVRVKGLAVPEGEPGPFHIVEVKDLQRRYVLPCRLAPIVVTSNAGSSFQAEVSLDDPALRRRFTGGWLQFTDYPDTEAAEILAHHLSAVEPAVTSQARLIWAMLGVRARVFQYQADHDLVMLLDPGTMITWGRKLLTYFRRGEQGGGAGDPLREAFLEAARDIWIDKVCPLAGDALNDETRNELIGFVRDNAPAALL